MRSLKCLLLALAICIAASAVMAETVWVPAKINGKKGDVVLSAGETGDMIHDLVAILGAYWNHAGMLIDEGETIRHNIMYADEIEQVGGGGCGVPEKLDPEGLSNGLPGVISEDVDTTYNNEAVTKRGFRLAGGVIVRPSAANEAARRDFLELVADKMIFLRAYYRVNGFMNHYQMEELNHLTKGVGNHCSGTIWYANYYSGKTMNVATIPPHLVMQCAENLYDSVYLMVEDEVGCAKNLAPDLASDVANQVTNTFGFDRSDDLSDYWRTNMVGLSAVTCGPDHLLMNSFVNPRGESAGVQTSSSSYYDQVVPIEWTDGYWIGEEDPPEDPPGCR